MEIGKHNFYVQIWTSHPISNNLSLVNKLPCPHLTPKGIRLLNINFVQMGTFYEIPSKKFYQLAHLQHLTVGVRLSKYEFSVQFGKTFTAKMVLVNSNLTCLCAFHKPPEGFGKLQGALQSPPEHLGSNPIHL